MIDLKRTIKETKADMKPDSVEVERERYPYGLQVRLEEEEIAKLKLTLGNFDVGQKVTLSCKAEVTEIRSSVGLKRKSATLALQITHLDLDAGKKPKFAKYMEEQSKGPGE